MGIRPDPDQAKRITYRPANGTRKAASYLLGVGLADLGGFGRYFGQNKEILSVFYYGSVVHFNAGTVSHF
jgi:hypothetical protein